MLQAMICLVLSIVAHRAYETVISTQSSATHLDPGRISHFKHGAAHPNLQNPRAVTLNFPLQLIIATFMQTVHDFEDTQIEGSIQLLTTAVGHI